MELKYILSPIICALIGWFTNYIAVKMLFHPKKPIKLGFVTLYGIFPKRQKALARNLGELVQGELISHEDIQKVIHDPSFLEHFRGIIEEYIDTLLKEKLAAAIPMVGMFLQGEAAEKVKALLVDELTGFVPEVIETTSAQLEEKLDFSDHVRQKVEQFSMDKLEEILFSIMKSEFKFIEVVGGVLGFVIGVFQAILFAF